MKGNSKRMFEMPELRDRLQVVSDCVLMYGGFYVESIGFNTVDGYKEVTALIKEVNLDTGVISPVARTIELEALLGFMLNEEVVNAMTHAELEAVKTILEETKRANAIERGVEFND